MEIMTLDADDSIGATLAFTHKRKNYLSTVTDIYLSKDEGKLNIITAAGEKMQIIRRDEDMDTKPVLVGMSPDSDFNSGDEIHGVLFRRD